MRILQQALAARGARFLDLFRASPPRTADTAKERLQVVLALERSSNAGPSFLPQLQEEILLVIKKYVDIDNENVSIELERGPEISMLGITIELPGAMPVSASASRRLPVCLQGAH